MAALKRVPQTLCILYGDLSLRVSESPVASVQET
jgi:hypothetical protein